MSIKSDRWIKAMAAKGMIEPFEPAQVRTGQAGKVISYGVSSYGYDVRLRAPLQGVHQHQLRHRGSQGVR